MKRDVCAAYWKLHDSRELIASVMDTMADLELAEPCRVALSALDLALTAMPVGGDGAGA